jgi:hypothetical protein
MNSDQSTVAIYWDFENIHASILDQKKGPGSYKQSRFTECVNENETPVW